MFDAQIAAVAASVNERGDTADVKPRAAAYLTWLEAQPKDTPQHVADAQAALLGAALAFVSSEGYVEAADVTARAATLLTATQGLSGYPGDAGGDQVINVRLTAVSAAAANGDVVVVTATGKTVTAPAPAKGATFVVIASGFDVTVAPHGAETVRVTSVTNGTSLRFYSDGTNWY